MDSAQNAIDDLQGFDLFGRQMSLDFAKARSDATVKREDGDAGLEEHKKQRLAEKGMFWISGGKHKQDCHADSIRRAQTGRGGRSRRRRIGQTPTGRQRHARPPGEEREAYRCWWSCAGRIPSPNKTLFLRDLPEDYGKDALAVIFKRYPGFREIRVVPGRNTIAFAEYEDETGAIAAKEALSGIELSGQKIRITYQRQ